LKLLLPLPPLLPLRKPSPLKPLPLLLPPLTLPSPLKALLLLPPLKPSPLKPLLLPLRRSNSFTAMQKSQPSGWLFFALNSAFQ
jgi:hypothetical protein